MSPISLGSSVDPEVTAESVENSRQIDSLLAEFMGKHDSAIAKKGRGVGLGLGLGFGFGSGSGSGEKRQGRWQRMEFL